MNPLKQEGNKQTMWLISLQSGQFQADWLSLLPTLRKWTQPVNDRLMDMFPRTGQGFKRSTQPNPSLALAG